MDINYLSQLNEQQKAAVEYIDGPELVIAGAGSGKTRVLTYKIVHLLAKQYNPGRILALTFTNKAAREMRERIESLVGFENSRRLWMGTFHSIFSRILRKNANLIGYTSNYTIYDTKDSQSLIKTIVKDLGLDEKVYKPSTILNSISNAKNHLYSPSAYLSDRDLMENDRRAKRGETAEIYRIYMSRCRVADAMDFDDLLYYTAVLFRDHPEVLSRYREFFQYILIDEYQDTNFAQNMIMLQLAHDTGKICVVGDDAQSIYSFRGANIGNILNLKKEFPNLATFKLEQNYRSTQNIINAANSLIAKNERQIRKNVYSLNEKGERIEVQAGYSDYDEAGMVASRIVTRRASSGDKFSDFAILYRTNAQSRVLEESLRKRNIPYRIYGGLAFYQRKEIKDVLSYFRLAVNPHDDEALKRVINIPARGIGKTTLEKLSNAAISNNISIWATLKSLDKYEVKLNSGTLAKLYKFVGLIDTFIELNESGTNAEDLANEIIRRTGILAMYVTENTPESISKQENIGELIKSAHDFVEERQEEGNDVNVGMADFLAEVSLATDQDEDDPTQADSVTLMTIHAAKGLEFSNVFIVGVEDELIPSMRCRTVEDVEEERRLFYVAITRAKEFCMISYASSRFLNGQTTASKPSRFLKDIDSACLRCSFGASTSVREKRVETDTFGVSGMQPKLNFKLSSTPIEHKPVNSGTISEFTLHDISEIEIGMQIVHSKFGNGTVKEMTSSSTGDVITVYFKFEGEKKLLLKFAKFKILR